MTDMSAHTWNPCTEEPETGKSQVQVHPGLHRDYHVLRSKMKSKAVKRTLYSKSKTRFGFIQSTNPEKRIA